MSFIRFPNTWIEEAKDPSWKAGETTVESMIIGFSSDKSYFAEKWWSWWSCSNN
jgi:hypothetical protein